MLVEETRFRSSVPDEDRQGRHYWRPVTVVWYRYSDGIRATPWSPLRSKADERPGNRCPSAEKLWERGSTFLLAEQASAF